MSEIIFIRHAETSLAGTFCGQSDPPINSAGVIQIEALRRSLQVLPQDILYSSDLRRAYSTALHLVRNDASRINVSPALREINFGDWEGLHWTEIERRDRAFARLWVERFPAITAPHGEPYGDFSNRVIQCVNQIEHAHPGERVLVVTHAGVMREILQRRCGMDQQQAWQHTREYCCTFSLATHLASEKTA